MRCAGPAPNPCVVSKQNWPQLSLEEVVRLQPDYIVFAEDHGGGDVHGACGFARASGVARSRRRREGARGECERRGRAAFAGIGGCDRAAGARRASGGVCAKKREIRNAKFETRHAIVGACTPTASRGVQPVRPLTPRRVAWICARAGRRIVCGGGDFAAHGRLSDFGARHRQDAFQRRPWPLERHSRASSDRSCSGCGCRAFCWEFWWARRFRPPARAFRRCCAIRWPIRTCWAYRAARRWARSSA